MIKMQGTGVKLYFKILYLFLFSPTHTTSTAHPIFFDLITQTTDSSHSIDVMRLHLHLTS